MTATLKFVGRILLLGGFVGAAGCDPTVWPPPHAAGAAACNDPCATMTCPGGTRCSSDPTCHPRCEVEPLQNGGFKP